MYNECRLSNVTKAYLERFYDILDKMIAGMQGAELTESISHNFIVQMIPHHRAAIEMSESLLKYTTFIPLQDIAEGIITEQKKSIQNMLEIEAECSKMLNSPRDVKLYTNAMERIMNNMFCKMQDARVDNNINADFMRQMIPHHKGAIQMSKTALQFGICPELKPILTAIIRSQEKGVRQMTQLLRR